jgi:hypothetical protein
MGRARRLAAAADDAKGEGLSSGGERTSVADGVAGGTAGDGTSLA